MKRHDLRLEPDANRMNNHARSIRHVRTNSRICDDLGYDSAKRVVNTDTEVMVVVIYQWLWAAGMQEARAGRGRSWGHWR